MFDIYRICGVAVLGLTLTVVLKNKGSTIGPYITQVSAIVIVITAITSIVPLIVYIKELSSGSNVDSDIVHIILSASAITLICRTVSDICRENGEVMLKNAVEFAGNVEIMLLSLPIIKDLLSGVIGLIKL